MVVIHRIKYVFDCQNNAYGHKFTKGTWNMVFKANIKSLFKKKKANIKSMAWVDYIKNDAFAWKSEPLPSLLYLQNMYDFVSYCMTYIIAYFWYNNSKILQVLNENSIGLYIFLLKNAVWTNGSLITWKMENI